MRAHVLLRYQRYNAILISFDLGAFLTLPRAKPDDTATERRSISASRNALAINVILKAAMASSPQIARASFTFEHIGRGRGSVCATGHCFDAFFRSELTEGHTPGVTAKCQLRRALSHLWLVLRHDR